MPFALNSVDVVVTASRIEEDSSTVPAIVTVIDEEDLEDEATVISALEKVPQVNVTYTNVGKQFVSMGGFGEDGFLRVLILIDGVPVNRPDMTPFIWGSIPLAKVERIEIIQGGASVLYGDQAVAGVINIITKDENNSTLTVKAGVDTRLSNTQSLTGQYKTGDLSLFSSLSRTDTKSSRDRGDSSMWSVTLTPSIRKKLFSFSSEFYYTPEQYDMPGGLTAAQYDADPDQAANMLDSFKGINYGVNTHTSFDLGDLNIDMPLTLLIQDSSTDMTSWGSYYDSLLTDVNVRPQGAYEIWLGDSLLQPLAGVDGKYTSISVDHFSDTARSTKTSDATVSRLTASPWILLKYSYQDRIMAEAGARYYYTRLNAEFAYNPTINGERSTAPIAYNSSLTWIPLPGSLKTFVNYNYVFKLPALDKQVYYSGFGSDGIKELDPEYGHSVTAGLEGAGDNWKISLSPYFTYMFDEIYYDSVAGANKNGAETKRLGGILSGSCSLGMFDLSAGYTYVNATYASGANEGKQVTLVSPHKINWSLKMNLPAGFSLSSDGTYHSSYYQGGDEANSLDQVEGRNNLGIKANWVSDFGLALTAYVDNLMNCRTPAYVYYDSWSGSSWYPTEGRVLGLQAAWTY